MSFARQQAYYQQIERERKRAENKGVSKEHNIPPMRDFPYPSPTSASIRFNKRLDAQWIYCESCRCTARHKSDGLCVTPECVKRLRRKTA